MRLVGWLVCRVGRGAHSKRAIRAGCGAIILSLGWQR